ncbi:urotensin 1 [Callorhinchus milii]|uniref:urotensin 1 n=1 Tax=Callorhinchus milii TaxID=7868 RepID=UPI0004571EA6|nr:urotensin 1 [Callorhinchus milii]|eukprot:gi/632972458/ref/XP_007902667.1/ PREDICTED: urocortin [Callorhinchus milii]
MTPTPFIILAASLLLVTHNSPAVCRAVHVNMFHRGGSNINEVMEDEIHQSVSYILKEKVLQSLVQNPKYIVIRSLLPPDNLQIVKDITAKEVSRLLRQVSLKLESPLPAQGINQKMIEIFAERSKRPSDPPISLDLTFHILREMIEIAKNENQWIQAHTNRKIMDMVGK